MSAQLSENSPLQPVLRLIHCIQKGATAVFAGASVSYVTAGCCDCFRLTPDVFNFKQNVVPPVLWSVLLVHNHSMIF